MTKTTVKVRGTSDRDHGPGRHLDQFREGRVVSTADGWAISTAGLMTIRVNKEKKIKFVYDTEVMDNRKSNVLANASRTLAKKSTGTY